MPPCYHPHQPPQAQSHTKCLTLCMRHIVWLATWTWGGGRWWSDASARDGTVAGGWTPGLVAVPLVSRILCARRCRQADGHSSSRIDQRSGTGPAGPVRLNPGSCRPWPAPGRRPVSPALSCTARGLSCLLDRSWSGGLLPHLFTLTLRQAEGGLFSATLSVGRGSRPGCPRFHGACCLVVSGLSSATHGRNRGHSDHLPGGRPLST